MKESPIFIKSFEMLQWLLNHTRKFPKHKRFVMARRMEEAALDFHDEVVRATDGVVKFLTLGPWRGAGTLEGPRLTES